MNIDQKLKSNESSNDDNDEHLIFIVSFLHAISNRITIMLLFYC